MVPVAGCAPVFEELQRIYATHHSASKIDPLFQKLSLLFSRLHQSILDIIEKPFNEHCLAPALDDFCELLLALLDRLGNLALIFAPLVTLPFLLSLLCASLRLLLPLSSALAVCPLMHAKSR